jgi:hypothetical protein
MPITGRALRHGIRHHVRKRRGQLKDLANTPTQMACGYRMYGDLGQLRALVGSVVVIDLLSGTCTVDGGEEPPHLGLASEAAHWVGERLTNF